MANNANYNDDVNRDDDLGSTTQDKQDQSKGGRSSRNQGDTLDQEGRDQNDDSSNDSMSYGFGLDDEL